MIYFILSLFIGLTITLLVYAILKIKKFGSNSFMGENNNFSLQKLDLNKWRGGVRFPAGYYKTKEDFYKIEKSLRYHR